MNIIDKLKYAKEFLNISSELFSGECIDIAILERHIVYKIKDELHDIKFLKFSIKEILKSVLGLDTHVYCTNCVQGDELIISISHDTSIPNCCEECNPYNLEDSTPFKDRPNYIPKSVTI